MRVWLCVYTLYLLVPVRIHRFIHLFIHLGARQWIILKIIWCFRKAQPGDDDNNDVGTCHDVIVTDTQTSLLVLRVSPIVCVALFSI